MQNNGSAKRRQDECSSCVLFVWLSAYAPISLMHPLQLTQLSTLQQTTNNALGLKRVQCSSLLEGTLTCAAITLLAS